MSDRFEVRRTPGGTGFTVWDSDGADVGQPAGYVDPHLDIAGPAADRVADLLNRIDAGYASRLQAAWDEIQDLEDAALDEAAIL